MIPRARGDSRRRSQICLASLALGAIALLSVAAPIWIAIFALEPYAPDVRAIRAAPSFAHLLGTDDLGRDVFARLLLGGRVSILVAMAAVSSSAIVGTCLGLWFGYRGGIVDATFTRVTDALIAIPKLPLLLLLAAVDIDAFLPGSPLERSEMAAVLRIATVIALLGWTSTARLARARAIELRARDWVIAQRALGFSDARIIATHLLPNALGPIVVAATIDVGEVILYEGMLSFLGLGVPPPLPSWGSMMAHGMENMRSAPALVVAPALATFVTVLCCNALGEALRDTTAARRT